MSGMAEHAAASGSKEWADELPVLRTMTRREFRELFSDLEPATEDDVPWTFPVRTPLEQSDTPR